MSVGSNLSAAVDCLPNLLTTVRKYLYVMKKGGGSESTIVSRVYALHNLKYVLGLAQFLVFVPNSYYAYVFMF